MASYAEGAGFFFSRGTEFRRGGAIHRPSLGQAEKGAKYNVDEASLEWTTLLRETWGLH